MLFVFPNINHNYDINYLLEAITKMKKKIIGVILLCLTVFSIGIFYPNKDGNNIQVKSNDWFTSNNIPTNIKQYPVIYNNLRMTVIDENSQLSYEDKCTLTNYVDLWVTANDSRGIGWQKDEVAKFANDEYITNVEDAIAENLYDWTVEGAQILTMTVEDDGQVEIPFILKMTGQNENEGIPEGTYESLEALRFKKVNNNWYLTGIAFDFMAPAGTINYSLDDLSGKYTLEVTDEYYQ